MAYIGNKGDCMKPKFINTIWKLCTYDVWGNAKDGYDVNDVYGRGNVSLRLRVETANLGTLQEFDYASPSDYQIKQIFGFRGRIDMDGDDTTIYVNRLRDGYPLGELHLVSHSGLSPIHWERIN